MPTPQNLGASEHFALIFCKLALLFDSDLAGCLYSNLLVLFVMTDIFCSFCIMHIYKGDH